MKIWTSRFLRGIWRLLRLPLLAFLVMAGLVAFFQERLLHFPEKIELDAALREAGERRLTPWPTSANPRGWLREPVGKAKGTVVLFHGNAGQALQRSWLADELADKMGYRCILAEHPGYGHRQGGLDEKSLAGDAALTIRQLRAAYPEPLIVAGESLGAGVAAAAVAQAGNAVDGVLLITPWNNLADVAGHHYSWLPVRLLLRDSYDTVENLRQFRGPTALIVAGKDQVIPPRFGLALHTQLSGRPILLNLPLADHNNWMESMTPQQWQALMAFFASEVKNRKTGLLAVPGSVVSSR